MDKKTLMQYCGSLQQVACIRQVTHHQGRAEGLNSYILKNGPLSCIFLGDKCLDIGELNYKGINLNFLSKPGLINKTHMDTNGEEALRSIMGGFMFTAGLENICAPYISGGKKYPMHGRIRTTPAENISSETIWENEELVLNIRGDIREAELFGENLVIHRNIKSVYGTSTIEITDIIENEGFRDETLMLLYHINLGFPFLSENCEIILPTIKVMPRDDTSKAHLERWNLMDKPKDNEDEYVFIHDLATDLEENTFAGIYNHELGMGIKIEFSKKQLSYFMEWKSTASGDYAVGLEPANSSVYGRGYHETEGTLQKIKPFQKKTFQLKVHIVEGSEAYREMQSNAKNLIDKSRTSER